MDELSEGPSTPKRRRVSEAFPDGAVHNCNFWYVFGRENEMKSATEEFDFTTGFSSSGDELEAEGVVVEAKLESEATNEENGSFSRGTIYTQIGRNSSTEKGSGLPALREARYSRTRTLYLFHWRSVCVWSVCVWGGGW